MNPRLHMLSDGDMDGALDWRVIAPEQIWQAAREPYLCTVVRSPDDDGGFYATIVRSSDLDIVVLEDAATLDDAQMWCAEWVVTHGHWGLGDGVW